MPANLNDGSIDEDALILAAARARPPVDAWQAAHLADEAGLVDGRARTRLLMAHLQSGDADEAIAACAVAIARRADLADFCKELVNHAEATPRTLKTFIAVVAAAMPSHPAARLGLGETLVGRAAYDAMWVGEELAVAAPLALGFAPSFDGVLISTEEPLRRFTTFSVTYRSGDIVHLLLHDKTRFTSDDYWVAPPCLLLAGSLGEESSPARVLEARLRRGWRRVTAMVRR
jgi:hypothetical protein